MDINKIEIFLRAIELGSLSKAAEEYLYTPSALSHIVDSIEDEIGVKLIKRTHTGIDVIEECRDIIDRLQNILEIKNEVMSLSSKKQKNDNILTIGTYSSLSKYILPALTKNFMQIHPKLKFNIIVADDLSVFLREGKVDILFGENLYSDNYIWIELMTDPYTAVFPQNNIIREKIFHRDRKYAETLIIPNDSKVKAYLNIENYRDVLTVHSEDDSSIIQMIKAEMGFSVLPTLSLESSRDQVDIIPLDPPLVRTLGFNYKKDLAISSTLRKFVKAFSSII